MPELSACAMSKGIFPLAAGVLLLAYVEGVSAGRIFADKHGGTLDMRQEFLWHRRGQSRSCAGARLVSVAGGLSLIWRSMTRRVRRVLLAAGLCIDHARALSSVSDQSSGEFAEGRAVGGGADSHPRIVRFSRARAYVGVSRIDFYAATIALFAVLLLGILNGILLAALACIALRFWCEPRARMWPFSAAFPARIYYSDMERHPDNEPSRHSIVVRPEASLIYVNAGAIWRLFKAVYMLPIDRQFVLWCAISRLHRSSTLPALGYCMNCMPNWTSAVLRCGSSGPGPLFVIFCAPTGSATRWAASAALVTIHDQIREAGS